MSNEDENEIDVLAVVLKLIGPIDPVGETHTDEKRFENLKQMCNLTDSLLSEIDGVVWRNKNAYQHSVKRSVEYGQKFFNDIGIKE